MIPEERKFVPRVGIRYPCFLAETRTADAVARTARAARLVYMPFDRRDRLEGVERLFVSTTPEEYERLHRLPYNYDLQPDAYFLYFRRGPRRSTRGGSLRPRPRGLFIQTTEGTVARTSCVEGNADDVRIGMPMTCISRPGGGFFRPAREGEPIVGSLISYSGITGPLQSVDILLFDAKTFHKG